jgi:hypothetical protein
VKKKFPKWGSLAYDYAALESARQMLRKPNKCICLYCRVQAVKESDIRHEEGCPVPANQKREVPCDAT